MIEIPDFAWFEPPLVVAVLGAVFFLGAVGVNYIRLKFSAKFRDKTSKTLESS